MELKQLYKDATVLCKTEMPLPDFLLYCDMGARRYLNRYPKKLLLPHGEHIAPESISDSLALHEIFYNAMLYFIAGSFLASDACLARAENEADYAYRVLWRRAAYGKRRKGDAW